MSVLTPPLRATVAVPGWAKNELWRKARAVPSLDLRFADSKSLVDATTGQNLITFTRASSGTFVGSNGLIQTAANNVPRFDHNPVTGESLGLLVEEARTNLLVQSEDFSTTWTADTGNPTLSTNVATSPNGTTTADKLIEGTASGGQNLAQAVSISTAGQYTFSVYAKAAERFKFLLRESTSTGAAALYSLTTSSVLVLGGGGTPTPTASIQPLANGWFRCTLTMNQASTGSRTFRVYVVDDAETTLGGSIANRTGDGASGLFIWGAQLEAGAFPTSYIPTTTATVTRSADVCSISGSNFSSWFTNANENTFYVEAIKTSADVPNGTFFCGSDSSVNAITGGWITYNGTGERMRFQSRHSSVRGDTQNNAAVITSGALIKGALCTSTTTFGASYNGSLIASTTTPVQLDWSTSLAIGWFPNGGYTSALNGTIRRLTYWPTRLSNTTLQAVTQ
jgi:hypothetical protein